MKMVNTHLFDSAVGLLKLAAIVGYDDVRGVIKVQLNDVSALKGYIPQSLDIPAPHALFYNNGIFICFFHNTRDSRAIVFISFMAFNYTFCIG